MCTARSKKSPFRFLILITAFTLRKARMVTVLQPVPRNRSSPVYTICSKHKFLPNHACAEKIGTKIGTCMQYVHGPRARTYVHAYMYILTCAQRSITSVFGKDAPDSLYVLLCRYIRSQATHKYISRSAASYEEPISSYSLELK